MGALEDLLEDIREKRKLEEEGLSEETEQTSPDNTSSFWGEVGSKLLGAVTAIPRLAMAATQGPQGLQQVVEGVGESAKRGIEATIEDPTRALPFAGEVVGGLLYGPVGAVGGRVAGEGARSLIKGESTFTPEAVSNIILSPLSEAPIGLTKGTLARKGVIAGEDLSKAPSTIIERPVLSPEADALATSLLNEARSKAQAKRDLAYSKALPGPQGDFPKAKRVKGDTGVYIKQSHALDEKFPELEVDTKRSDRFFKPEAPLSSIKSVQGERPIILEKQSPLKQRAVDNPELDTVIATNRGLEMRERMSRLPAQEEFLVAADDAGAALEALTRGRTDIDLPSTVSKIRPQEEMIVGEDLVGSALEELANPVTAEAKARAATRKNLIAEEERTGAALRQFEEVGPLQKISEAQDDLLKAQVLDPLFTANHPFAREMSKLGYVPWSWGPQRILRKNGGAVGEYLANTAVDAKELVDTANSYFHKRATEIFDKYKVDKQDHQLLDMLRRTPRLMEIARDSVNPNPRAWMKQFEEETGKRLELDRTDFPRLEKLMQFTKDWQRDVTDPLRAFAYRQNNDPEWPVNRPSPHHGYPGSTRTISSQPIHMNVS